MDSVQPLGMRDRLYRRRFLVPNLVTVGNMFCGFLSGIYAASGRFEKAAIAIGLAILLDGLDGRVARRLNATSKFGVEFDSFSDLVSFGIAPALLMYHWAFRPLADEFGVFITFVYALAAASRLARFNITEENLKSFQGLPSPGAAAFVAALVNAGVTWGIQPSLPLVILGSIMMGSIGYLMVSKIEFFSIKQLRIRGTHLGVRLALGAAIVLVCWYNNQIGFLAVTGAYVLSGPLDAVRRRRNAQFAFAEDDEEEKEQPLRP